MDWFRKIKEQFEDAKEVVTWSHDATEGTFVWRIPTSRDTSAYSDITTIKKFGVRGGFERAVFLRSGTIMGVLDGGVYELEKDARNEATEIIWVHTAEIRLPWGITLTQAIRSKDGFKLGMHGYLNLQVIEPETFITKIVAAQPRFTAENVRYWIDSLIQTSSRDILKHNTLEAFAFTDREEVHSLMKTKLSENFSSYGLELRLFEVLGYKVAPDQQSRAKQVQEQIQRKIDLLLKDQAEEQTLLDEIEDREKDIKRSYLHEKINKEAYELKLTKIDEMKCEQMKRLEDIERKLTNIVRPS